MAFVVVVRPASESGIGLLFADVGRGAKPKSVVPPENEAELDSPTDPLIDVEEEEDDMLGYDSILGMMGCLIGAGDASPRLVVPLRFRNGLPIFEKTTGIMVVELDTADTEETRTGFTGTGTEGKDIDVVTP